jgi:hypothetical protein
VLGALGTRTEDIDGQLEEILRRLRELEAERSAPRVASGGR